MAYVTHRRDLTHTENIKRLKIQDKGWPKNENAAEDDTNVSGVSGCPEKKKLELYFPKSVGSHRCCMDGKSPSKNNRHTGDKDSLKLSRQIIFKCLVHNSDV